MSNVFDELNDKINKLPKDKKVEARKLFVKVIEGDMCDLMINLVKLVKYLRDNNV